MTRQRSTLSNVSVPRTAFLYASTSNLPAATYSYVFAVPSLLLTPHFSIDLVMNKHALIRHLFSSGDESMLNPDMVAIYCLVHREPVDRAFEVIIDKDRSVSYLRKRIKEEVPNKFANVSANNLTLWKVGVPTSDKQI